jgi:hypothetical protein
MSFFNVSICGRVVTVVDFKPLAPHRYGFEYRQGLWILSCKEAIQLAIVPKIISLILKNGWVGLAHFT